VRFLATRHFSPSASARTNTSHRHGVRASEPIRNLFYTRHYYWRTLSGDQYIRPSHIPLCRVKFVFLVGIRPRHGCHESQRSLLSVSSTLLGRPSPFRPRLWVLYPNLTLSVTALVFSAAPKYLTTHYPENNCECTSAFIGTRHH
jgi:hypothetical protein